MRLEVVRKGGGRERAGIWKRGRGDRAGECVAELGKSGWSGGWEE